MRQKNWIAVLAVLAVVLVAAAVLIWSGILPAGKNTAQGRAEPAPDFTVYTAEGVPVKLSDFKGKPVVLNFWASWCGPCKSEMPAFEEAYQQRDGQVQFLMVNLTGGSETVETAAAFLVDAGYTFPGFFDTEGQCNTAYRLSAIPATYFIDKKGNIVTSHVGAMTAATLQEYLEKIT